MKIIQRCGWLGVAMLLMQPSHALSAQDVKSTGQQATIRSQGSGPFFRLNLPVTIYPTASHVDLRDVRIRNASGDLVPYAWLQHETAAPQILSSAATIYPLTPRGNRSATEASNLSLEFKQNSDGSLLRIQTKTALTTGAGADSIIDVSQIKGSLLQARLELDEHAEGLFPLSIDASDDLQHWRGISSDEQIVVLKRQGAKIEKLSLDLYGNRGKFLRLHWHDATAAISIKSVTIDSLQQNEVPAPLQWSPVIKATSCSENYCDYPLPVNTPLDSLRINLSETNTLASVTVSGQRPARSEDVRPLRHHPLYVLRHKRAAAENNSAARTILAQTVSYRLSLSNGEARSENLSMDGAIYTHLRLQTQGPISMLGQTAPSIEVASMPRSLIFLGRGASPFSLSWGADETTGGALALSTLMPGYQSEQAVNAEVATVEIPLALISVTAIAEKYKTLGEAEKLSKSENKFWLWAALAAGLLLLAGMAWSLFNSMKKTE
ncbi:DUF3999 family protein [Undibacterium sp. Ren11W]|uniref:DUF3999 family protein n=1 Tax=Undibacterium sp. Ren11W TaxID=3413045 RepID=UPI003BF44D16